MIPALLLSVPGVLLSGDKALVLPAANIQDQLKQLAPQARSSGSSGASLAEYGNLELKTSVRTTSGGAEIHAHYDDLMIVQQGAATLITGGTVVDPVTSSNGETKGSSVQGGERKQIAVGDVVLIPAGLPHQLLIPSGTLYSALVAKIKEK
jgi:mannose-6-phosphate isomerase-like protein (cupin superfamily)